MYAYVRTWCVLRELCINKSKIASASEEPNLFELFRAPKIFEAQPQRALVKSTFVSLTMQRYGRYLADKRKKTHNMLIHKRIQVNTSGAQVSAQVCERKQQKKGTDNCRFPLFWVFRKQINPPVNSSSIPISRRARIREALSIVPVYATSSISYARELIDLLYRLSAWLSCPESPRGNYLLPVLRVKSVMCQECH